MSTQPSQPSVSAEVEVAIDPHTAFAVFADEMDLWWKRGPISFHDAARAVEKRCEPGVGGRLLEVYDKESGDALELGRITVWEPGARLAWTSSVDDVEVEVTFQPTRGGTLVRVDARISEDGRDRGGTSFVRVVPYWFPDWCARRDTVPHEPRDLARLAIAVYYRKPATAARWLVDAFGFTRIGAIPESDDAAYGWIEFHVGNCSVILFRLDDTAGDSAVTHVPWVFVDDLDAHLAQAQASGATIVEPVHQHGYRAYVAADIEGHRWTFAQARPTMP
jgi:uncharacterized glyoxalase superfamily protein PhnB